MEAAIVENTKICTGCKKEMLATKEFFHSSKGGKYGLRPKCKQCINGVNIKRNEGDCEKAKEFYRKWKKDYSEKVKERSRKYTKNLTDSYVANCLRAPLNHLNPQVIETRRLIILIKRELRKNNFKTLETMQEDSTNKNNSQMENNLKENDNKRDLNFEVNNSDDLNKMLSGFLMDVRRGSVTHYSANSINLVADKINKNNCNQLEYKRLSGGNKKIDFFEKE